MTNHTRPSTMTKIRTRLALTALALGCAFASAPVAEAQFGGRSGMASLFTPDFLPRDMPVFVDSLALEEWQRPVLEVLLQDYETGFSTAADGVRAKMASFKDVASGASADRVIELISEPLVAWTAEKKKLREELLTSVRSILGESQVEYWPRLERALRREKSLPNGELSGESVDLTLILRETQASPLALDAARPAIDNYEIKLDEALVARDAVLDSAIAPLLKAMSASDINSGVAAQESIMVKRIAVRDAQEAGILAIRDALGAEYGSAFERRALQRAFPQVFRPDPIQPLIDGALALPDISDDQKQRLTALNTQYGLDLNTLHTTLMDAYKATEPGEPRRRTDLARQKAEGGTVRIGDAPQLEAAKKAREDLYSKYRDLLAAILSPAQREAVPGFVKESAPDPEKEKASRAAAREAEAATSGGDAPARPQMSGPKSGSGGLNQKPDRPLSPAENGTGPTSNPTVKPKSVD